jgi:hypothetical protein
MKHLSDHIRQLSRRYFPLQLSLGSAKASYGRGLANTGWESRKPIQEVLMKKPFPANSLFATQLLAATNRRKVCRWIAVLLLAGCTNTQVRWDATRMRKDVMVYYNDQIMDNLIKAKNKLPFVHVDIQTLTSTGGSQISGTVGYGETTSNSSTRAGATRTTTDTTSATPSHVVSTAVAVPGTLAHVALRPFAYSVTPQQTESLSIIAAPALGGQALASPSPAASPAPKPTWQETKKTTTADLEEPEKPTLIVTEEVKSAPTPSPITLYKLYDDFARDPPRGHLSHSPVEPKKGTYVPGTLKKGPTPEGGPEYYFIASNKEDQEKYYEFCKALFTKGQAGSLEKKLDVIQAASLGLR